MFVIATIYALDALLRDSLQTGDILLFNTPSEFLNPLDSILYQTSCLGFSSFQSSSPFVSYDYDLFSNVAIVILDKFVNNNIYERDFFSKKED